MYSKLKKYTSSCYEYNYNAINEGWGWFVYMDDNITYPDNIKETSDIKETSVIRSLNSYKSVQSLLNMRDNKKNDDDDDDDDDDKVKGLWVVCILLVWSLGLIFW